jgi:hypothetical protein
MAKIATHPRNNYPLPELPRLCSGVGGQTARRSPRSVALGLQARLRAQRRNARAVVLSLRRVAVEGGGDRGRGGVGGGGGPV